MEERTKNRQSQPATPEIRTRSRLHLVIAASALVLAFGITGCSNPLGGDSTLQEDGERTLPVNEDHNYTPDGSSDDLSDYGFTGVNAVEVNEQGEIVTTGSGGWSDLSTFMSPEIIRFDRSKGATIAAEWQVIFPSEKAAGTSDQNYQENNKIYLQLYDGDEAAYELMYRPNHSDQVNTTSDFELKAGNGADLENARSGIQTATGTDAEWISFRLELSPLGESGGDGNIRVYLQNSGEQDSWEQVLTIEDERHSAFTRFEFRYKTGNGETNYSARIRGLSISSR